MKTKPSMNRARHKAQCTICAHAECAEIETGFVNWASPANLAEQYGPRRRNSASLWEGLFTPTFDALWNSGLLWGKVLG